MGVKRAGLAAPSSDSKYSSARLTPSQSKRPISCLTPVRNGGEAIRIVQVHQLAPVELGVLQNGGFLAPLGMIVPEFFADVRQFQPDVNQDRLAVAGFDQAAQVFVGLGRRFVVVPAGDVQRADAGFAPALGEIIQIDARAIGAVEESPQALAAEGRLHAEIVRAPGAGRGSVRSLPCRARRRSTARRRSRDAKRDHHGSMVPAFGGENGGVLGHIEDGNFERRSPRRSRAWARARSTMLRTTTCLSHGLESERGREFALAFEDHDAALLDPLDPLRNRAGRDVANNEKIRGAARARVSPMEEKICGQGPGSSPAMW